MSGYGPGQEWPPPPSWAPPTQTLPPHDTWWDHPPASPPRSRASRLPATLGILTALVTFVGLVFVAGVPALTSRLPWIAATSGDGADRGGPGVGLPGGASGTGSDTSGLTGSAASAVARIAPAVVMITSTFGYQQASGAGTGIVLTADGEVLTNNHVINGATRIRAVDVGNGRTYTATVIGYDSSHDLALLRLKGASGLRTAQVGDSTKLSVGDPVVASGNAGGTGTTTSVSGAITGLEQSITATDEMTGVSERLTGLIEVDAAIQPGDSGGPLVDLSGRLIGVDTAASVGMRFQGAGGRGYAIPISRAMATVRQIESGQASSTVHIGATAFLGVMLGAGRDGAQDGGGQGGDGFGGAGTGGTGTGGAMITGVVRGGSAARAGLVAGDVITNLDGHTIDSATTLSQVMSGLHPGDRVRLGWVDGGGTSRSVTVRLDAGPPA